MTYLLRLGVEAIWYYKETRYPYKLARKFSSIMYSTPPLERLREEHKKIEEELQRLTDQKRKVDDFFSSIIEEERKLIEEIRKCRDPYEYSKMDIRLNRISRSRKEVQTEKEETERKIRGLEEELIRIRKRVQYLNPRSQL